MIAWLLVGFFGLGIVVFVHELGHFLAARAVGIEVEAFSIGWGKAIWARKIRGVEYRIGSLPVGGYCKMKGEAEFRDALIERKSEIPREPGTFYGSAPWRRIIVAFSGPTMNALFAVLVLSAVWGCGVQIRTVDNRIVLASEIEGNAPYPADDAGLMTGDRIVSIEGKKVSNFQEVQEGIAPWAEKNLTIEYERSGRVFSTSIRPRLDPATGAGKIGVYFWTDPVIAEVRQGSPAAIAGLRKGDRIISANGVDIPYTVLLSSVLESRPSTLALEIERAEKRERVEVILPWMDEVSIDTGIEFETIVYRTPRLSIPAAIAKGSYEAYNTFLLSIRSLTMLFRGVDLTKAVSGPIRITYMAGEIAANGFGQGVGQGISALAGFLALLSIALFIMNLLPIPALDGGLILLFLVELIIRRPLSPKTVYVYQLIGTAIIFGLLIFSLFGDILFLIGR